MGKKREAELQKRIDILLAVQKEQDEKRLEDMHKLMQEIAQQPFTIVTASGRTIQAIATDVRIDRAMSIGGVPGLYDYSASIVFPTGGN